MSSRVEVDDQRVLLTQPDGAKFLYGPYRSRNSNGGNYVPGAQNNEHPYTAVHVNSFSGFYEYRTKTYSNPWSAWGQYGPVTGVVTPLRSWDSNDELKLIGKLRNVIDSHDFNASVFVGELGKTVDMLATRTRHVGLMANAVRRGNLVGAAHMLGLSGKATNRTVARGQRALNKAIKNHPKGKPLGPSGERDYHPDNFRDERFLGTLVGKDRQRVTDAHLEIQYGLLPLIDDVYSLSGAIQARDKPREARMKASRTIKHSVSSSFPTIFGCQGYAYTQKQIIAVIIEEIPTLGERMGLTNPAAVLWELLPWSFVADWFIPIGSYIEARGFTSRNNETTYIITTTDKVRIRSASMSSSYVPDYVPPEQSEYRMGSLWWTSSCTMNRTLATSLSQSVPLPCWKSPLNGTTTRLANAVALVVSAFKH